jgi:hypothetical protein
MRAHVLYAVVGLAAAGCGNAGTAPDIDAAPASCSAGEQRCAGTTLQTCSGGTFYDTEVCLHACSDTLGCVLCVPGTGTCDSADLSYVCNATGTGYDSVTCDTSQGISCGASGFCEGTCVAGDGYIGCEYYPTVTGNMTSAQFHFAVAIANATDQPATVSIADGSLPKADVFVVPARGVRVELLPWYQALKLCTKGSWMECAHGNHTDAALVGRAAYHVRSTQPVTVYQFNPLEYALPDVPNENSFSNDASLLFPVNRWRKDYYVAAFGVTDGTGNPSLLAVTALHDGTHVTITTRADTVADGGAPAFAAGVPQTVTIDGGGVLEITSRTGDLTGSHVTADGPVQVIGGHYCADVPAGIAACDHLEDAMLPVDALGTRYVVDAPAIDANINGKPRTVRIIATAADTHLVYKPAQPGAPTTIAKPGDFVELADTPESFMITADHKVMVAQYMEGVNASHEHQGDPSLALAVPIDQFRTEYLFHAPTNYQINFVDVIAPYDANISLDQQLLAITPIGTTGYGFCRFPLSKGPAGDGNHRISGNAPFGIGVYGYGTDSSYWYPGGLQLIDVP